MRIKNVRGWILPLIMLIVSLVVVVGSLGLRLLDLDTYKEQIVASVQQSLKRELHYSSGEFSFGMGPSFSFNDITVKEKDGRSQFLAADRLTVRIALLPLLHHKLELSRMVLERPVLRLTRDKDGTFNVSDLLKEEPGRPPLGVKGVHLKHASISFTDYAVSPQPILTELVQTDLSLSQLTRGKECDFRLRATLKAQGRKTPVLLSGKVRIAPLGVPWTESTVEAHLHTDFLDVSHFWPYYGRFVPFRSMGGLLEVDSSFGGKLRAFRSNGTVRALRPVVDYPQVFHALLAPKAVTLAYDLQLGERDLVIKGVKLNVDGLNVQGSCALRDLYSGDMRIVARASSNSFNLKDFRQFIPYGIIIKDTSDFIEQKIAGGVYRLDDARLDGRVSQILHMERGQNYKVLYARAHVNDGVVAYGSGVPTFNTIRGELELAGKDFILKGMSGKFGGSPFALEGRIEDFPLVTPTKYPFSMALRPRQQEAAWLLARHARLSLTPGSLLRLKGEGTTTLYNMSGDWDLGSSGYSYGDLISKPAGRANTLSFRGSFSKEEFRLAALQYNLSPLSLALSASYRYAKGGGVALEVRTNQFAMQEVSPMLPSLRKYQPAGRMQALVHGRGSSLNTLLWGGEITVAGASLHPEKMKPVSNITGTLRFNGDSVETSQLSVRIGNSSVTGKGTLTGFKSPTVTLSASSARLELADLGLPQGKTPLYASNVHTTLSYHQGYLQIGYLTGVLGRSTLNVKGAVQDLQKNPRMELSVSSPHLDLEDLAPISEFSGSGSGAPSRFALRATVSAAEGSVQEIPFRKLHTVAVLENGVLSLQPLDFQALDGEMSARVRVELGSGPARRYQASYNMQHASAEKLLRSLGVKKQELTGSTHLQGELSARGVSSAEIKRSLQGSLKLRVDHGSIRKFSVLSKVFSILNVSQLLKFQLPDMVSGGMPFKRITGDLAVKDGVISTNNLFIDSDAINVSTVGHLDLVKDDLNLTIGVQPLQTVDKVVSHIPIVGWILTGRNRSLITTYFEAKGRVEDPKVTAVPVKSLAKGVFNIFKRVFELPARLITDTGEVVIGR